MSLLNSTTSIAVEKTLGEIQAILVKHRCRGTQTKYSTDGEITSLSFTVETEFGERDYLMPVNVDGVARTLKAEKEANRLPSLPWRVVEDPKALRAHAARVSWRIMKNWIESQLAIVQSRAVSFEQIMLPFQLDARGMTFYEAYRAQAALPAPVQDDA